MNCCISAVGLGARPRASAAAAGLPEIIAADRIAPAIATPVDADTTNEEPILCVISILHASVFEVSTRIFDTAPHHLFPCQLRLQSGFHLTPRHAPGTP